MSSQPPIFNVGEQPLVVELPPRPSFARRIQRAHDLADKYPSAAELLRFYALLAFHQEYLFNYVREAGPLLRFSDQWLVAIELLLPKFGGFARSVAEISPLPMSARASELATASSAEQSRLLTGLWENGLEPESVSAADRCIALSFLQPYAELLAGVRDGPSSTPSGDTCPICGSKPVCAVLRDRAHGAGRSLVCSLCMNEWNFLRVMCQVCGEDRFESLPVFTSVHIPHVRVDACDGCRHYIKTVDMTKDGLAVSVVDELAAVSLDIWATERKYRKLVPNLLGL